MEQPLSIINVLRYANHDFVNHLHLIRMNLDLGRVDEAVGIINKVSDDYRILSSINHLQVPITVEWLQTCRWRFPAVHISLQSDVREPIAHDLDEVLAQYLEKTVMHVYNCLDPFTEQQLDIAIASDKKMFTLKFDLKGQWDTIKFQDTEIKKLHVQTITETNCSWCYIVSITQE